MTQSISEKYGITPVAYLVRMSQSHPYGSTTATETWEEICDEIPANVHEENARPLYDAPVPEMIEALYAAHNALRSAYNRDQLAAGAPLLKVRADEISALLASLRAQS